MANLGQLIEKKTGKTIEKVFTKIKVEYIHYEKLKPSESNFYSQDSIEELADHLQLAGMILQPLLVQRLDIGEYEVIAGHRRRLADILCVEERNDKRFELVPCIVIKKNEMAADIIKQVEDEEDNLEELADAYIEYLMISTNSLSRTTLTPYEKMMETMKLREIIPKLTRDENMRGRALREAIAKETGYANGTIGTFENIYNNLISKGMNRFQNGDIGLTVASEIAGLPSSQQEQVLDLATISIRDIETIKGKKTVSESDTDKSQPISVEDPAEIEPKELDYEHENMISNMKIIFKKSNLVKPGCFECLLELFQSENVENYISCAKTYFDSQLPYQNEYVLVTRPNGYEVIFKQTNEKMTVPVIVFWTYFQEAFLPKKNSEDEIEELEDVEPVAAEDTNTDSDNNLVSDSDTDTETDEFDIDSEDETEPLLDEKPQEENKELYSLSDVQELYDKTFERFQQREEARNNNDPNHLVRITKNTKIQLDALKCLLERLKGDSENA